MIDHICSYRHRLSQNLVENYLLDNLENEYKNYKVKCEKIEKEKEKQKKKQSPEKLRKELDRLNFLFQKGRIEWDYYNEEYGRVESELNDLQSALPEPVTNYGYLEELLDTDFRTMYDQLSQENQSLQNRLMTNNEQKLQIEQKRVDIEEQVADDKAEYNDKLLELKDKQIQAEINQQFDGNPYNDRIRHI